MMDGMKITIQIDDKLISRAQIRAALTNRTLDAVTEDALRLLLTSRLELQPRVVAMAEHAFVLPLFKSGGEQPGVDLDNSAALLDRMEDTD
jgi:plasmid stability protein